MKEGFKKYITPAHIIRVSVLLVVCAIIYSLYENTYEHKTDDFRREKDHYFRTSINSPIEDKVNFKGLSYFDPDPDYKIKGTLSLIQGDSITSMLSSDGRKMEYLKYGRVHFFIDSIPYSLTLFKQTDTSQKHLLFLPFTDKTNGDETYLSGRYIDVDYPKKGIIEIDFNKAYHPYCVYSYRYSCPIPPQENFIDTYVRAGEKLEPIE